MEIGGACTPSRRGTRNCTGAKAGIGVYVMHMSADYLQFSACTELSQRGYRVLCANGSGSKVALDTDLNVDRSLLDAKLGVAWLRRLPGVRKVVLFGHSGGGVLMSSYQAIAEGGLAAMRTRVCCCAIDSSGVSTPVCGSPSMS